MNKVTNNVAAPTTFDAISGLVRGGLEATGKLAVAGTGGFTALTLNLADRLTRGASTEGLQRLAAQNAGAKGPAGALARALVLLDQLAKKHPVESIAGASLIPLVAAELGVAVASPVVAAALAVFLADTFVFCASPNWKFGDEPGDFFKFGDVKYPDPDAAIKNPEVR